MATYRNTRPTEPTTPDLSTVEATLATAHARLVQDDYKARTYVTTDLEATDPKGRRLGARVCRFTSTLEVWHDKATGEPAPRSSDWKLPEGGYEPRPGTVWCFVPQAMRAGKPYGASQATNMYDSEAEREAAILEVWGFGDVFKSGCVMCPYQGAGWYWVLRETDARRWAAVVEYEAVALAKNPKLGGIVAGVPVEQAVARWRARNPEATVRDVLAKSYSRCTVSKAQQRAEL